MDATRDEARKNRFLATVTAAVYSAVSPAYRWPLAYLMALVSVTMSRLAVDYVGALMPRGIGNKALLRLTTKWGQQRVAEGVHVRSETNVILAYDNNGT